MTAEPRKAIMTSRVVFVFGIFIFASCSDRNSPEIEQRASLAFEKAKHALTRGDHLEGRRLLNEIVTLDEGSNKLARHAEALLLLAENYSAGGEFETAEPLYRQSMELYAELGDKSGARAATIALASNAHERGDDNAAYEMLTQAIHLAEALRDFEGVRELKWSLIPAARAIEDIELENRTLNELLNDYVTAKDLALQAKVYHAMGKAALVRGLMAEAHQHMFKARELADRSGNPLLAIEILQQCALVSDRMGKPAEALRLLAEGLRRTDSVQGSAYLREQMLMRVVNIYMRQRRFDEARRFVNASLRSSIKSQNKLIEAYALIQLSRCINSSAAEARKALEAGAELIHSIGLPWANTFAYTSLGDHALKNNRLNEALNYYRNAVASNDSSYAQRDDFDVFADCEQTMFGQRKTYAYQALTDRLCTLGKTEEAFLAAGEHDRRELRRQFGGLQIRTRNRTLNASFGAYFRARCDYAGAEQKLLNAVSSRSESRALTENVQQSLKRASARMRDIADSILFINKQYTALLQSGAASLGEIQQTLPDSSVAVRYVPTTESLFMFIITRERVDVEVAAIGREQLTTLIRDYNGALEKNGASNDPATTLRVNELSNKLFQVFMRPLVSRIAPSSTLFIMLPNDLPLVALHSLRAPGNRSPYAIEQYSFCYMSGVELPKATLSQVRPPQSTVVFGNPGNSSWDVEYELRDIHAFVREARLYFNRDASMATLQKEDGDLLHCALDIRFNQTDPGMSYVVLTDGRGYTTATYERFGKLFAVAPFPTIIVSNIGSQPLHVGLPAILKMNGTKNVIVNNIAATRKAKKFFNEVFYTFLMAGNSPVVAYQSSVLQMMKDPECAAPGMWAPFFLW